MLVVHEQQDILKKLNYSAIRSNKLFMAEIDVTNRCNCHCFFCFQGNEHKDSEKTLSFDRIISLLDELKNLGCYHLSFAGGEPFCREDFLQILTEAKRRGFLITFVTNLQLPSAEQIEQLKTLGVAKILVSFHSHFPKTYSKIFNVDEKMYWRALDNIKSLIKGDTPIGITVTVSDYNVAELYEITEMFMELGVKKNDIRFNFLLEGKNPVTEHRNGQELHNYLCHHQELKTNILSKIRTDNLSFICTAGKASCVIRPNGDVLPCGLMNSVAGNINNISLKEIWNHSHTFQLIRSIDEKHFDKCKTCENLAFCPVCMATNLNETGNYHEPSDDYCAFRKCISSSFK